MFFAAVYALARLLVAIPCSTLRRQPSDLELLALRHEVAILHRHVKPPERLGPVIVGAALVSQHRRRRLAQA